MFAINLKVQNETQDTLEFLMKFSWTFYYAHFCEKALSEFLSRPVNLKLTIYKLSQDS